MNEDEKKEIRNARIFVVAVIIIFFFSAYICEYVSPRSGTDKSRRIHDRGFIDVR